MPYIICEWKQAGAYTLKDSINGVYYQTAEKAEKTLRNKGLDYQFVVRKIYS